MTNPVMTRNTAALCGTGATVQGIALITLLYLEILRLMGKTRSRK